MAVPEVLDRVAVRVRRLFTGQDDKALVAGIAVALLVMMLACWWWCGSNRKQPKHASQGRERPHHHTTNSTVDHLTEDTDGIQAAVPKLAPEVERLLALTEAFESTGRQGDPTKGWDSLLAIGDIYRRGAYPRLLPDDDLAAELYSVASRCPDSEVAGMAQARFVETREQMIMPIDRMGLPITPEPAWRAIVEARRRMQIMSLRGDILANAQRPRAVRRAAAARQRANTDMQDVAMLAEAVLGTGALPTVEPARLAVATTPTPKRVQPDPRSDPQNVHDHGVIAASRRLLTALPDPGKDVADSVAEARRVVQKLHNIQQVTTDDADNALRVLDRLTDVPNHSMGGVTEKQALRRVLYRISNTPDPETADALREILVRQLASGVEHNHVVCSTGKITRIASVFDGVEGALDGAPAGVSEAASARPMWAVRQELASLAAKVREEYLAGLSPGERAVYEAGGDTADGRHEAALRAKFEKDVHAEYVDKLGMSASVLTPIIAEMSEGF